MASKNFSAYDQDELLQSAVERQFEIIGEALNVARRDDPLLEYEITNLPGIIGTRNFLAHAYHAVVNAKLWDTAQNHLPLLRGELKALSTKTHCTKATTRCSRSQRYPFCADRPLPGVP